MRYRTEILNSLGSPSAVASPPIEIAGGETYDRLPSELFISSQFELIPGMYNIPRGRLNSTQILSLPKHLGRFSRAPRDILRRQSGANTLIRRTGTFVHLFSTVNCKCWNPPGQDPIRVRWVWSSGNNRPYTSRSELGESDAEWDGPQGEYLAPRSL
jgi:hypothetical protein